MVENTHLTSEEQKYLNDFLIDFKDFNMRLLSLLESPPQDEKAWFAKTYILLDY